MVERFDWTFCDKCGKIRTIEVVFTKDSYLLLCDDCKEGSS